jgi:hypothetical protein
MARWLRNEDLFGIIAAIDPALAAFIEAPDWPQQRG